MHFSLRCNDVQFLIVTTVKRPETREDFVEEQREAVKVSKGKNLKCGRLTPAAQMTILLVDTVGLHQTIRFYSI